MKSISGYVFIMNSGPISWRSKKQTVVALSSTEAEYVALAETIKEALWLKKLLIDLEIMNQNEAVVVNEDNQSCIKLAKNNSSHGRMKHVDIKYHFIRDQVEKEEIQIKYCNTENMVADMFTKSLGRTQYNFLRDILGVKCDQNLQSRESVEVESDLEFDHESTAIVVEQ